MVYSDQMGASVMGGERIQRQNKDRSLLNILQGTCGQDSREENVYHVVVVRGYSYRVE